MNICDSGGFDVSGLVVRTTNAAEMEPSTAKIGHLWAQFNKNVSAQLTETSKVYGLYTNYESDASGAYDVVACADTLSLGALNEMVKFQIPKGQYLKFSAKGQMPQVVINLWGEIWNYFNAANCIHMRAYTADFEYYKNETEVEVFIAVQ